jgi:antitoxin component YwqK of YwqJK toxin-antitoxin module
MSDKIQVKRYKSPDGTVRHIKDGKLHNADGPALIHPDGKEEYYLNGILLTKDDFKKRKKEGVGLPWYKSGTAKMRH